MTSLFTVNVYATGQPVREASQVRADANASRDILRNDAMWRTSLDSISWLTNIIDAGFATFISIVGLFIIGSALLKNVVAGAVAANPKFWDKVDTAHKQLAIKQGIGQGIRDTFTGNVQFGHDDNTDEYGTLSLFLYRLLPNFKAMSDFENPNVKPRTYFIKAIPQMFAVVYLGIFIWNGYYREVAAKVGDMGAVLTERAILDTDPISFIDRLTGQASAPIFPGLGQLGPMGFEAQLAVDLYSSIIGRYTDIRSKAARDTLASQLMEITKAMVKDDLAQPTLQSPQITSHVRMINTDDWFSQAYTRTVQIMWTTHQANFNTYTDTVQGVSNLRRIPYAIGQHSHVEPGFEAYYTYFLLTDVIGSLGLTTSMFPRDQFDMAITIRYQRTAEDMGFMPGSGRGLAGLAARAREFFGNDVLGNSNPSWSTGIVGNVTWSGANAPQNMVNVTINIPDVTPGTMRMMGLAGNATTARVAITYHHPSGSLETTTGEMQVNANGSVTIRNMLIDDPNADPSAQPPVFPTTPGRGTVQEANITVTINDHLVGWTAADGKSYSVSGFSLVPNLTSPQLPDGPID
jgi:hypothetical protein